MGRKVERYKRKLKREKQRMHSLEKSESLHNLPKMCPKCGTPMVLGKKRQRRHGGVFAEGSLGGLYMVEPGSKSSRNQALETAILVCPNCEYQMEN